MRQGVSYVQVSAVYIRNIIPDGMGIPHLCHLALLGRGKARTAQNMEFCELRLDGVLGSSRRSEPSEPSGGRGVPCFPSGEELAYGQEQAHKREYDEHDLVDVIFSGRQSAYQVRRPEQRVIP